MSRLAASLLMTTPPSSNRQAKAAYLTYQARNAIQRRKARAGSGCAIPDGAHLLGAGGLLRLEENPERRLPAGQRL